MDPLSVTASIITILHLTSTLTSYLNEVKHATAEQRTIAIEASNIQSLLTNLRYRVEGARSNDPWLAQVKLLGIANGPLEQLRTTLDEIVGNSTPSGKRGKFRAALSWKWTKAEIDAAIQRIERVKSVISIALSNDAFRLEQAIHSEMQAVHGDTQAIHHGIQTVQVDTQAINHDLQAVHSDTRTVHHETLAIRDDTKDVKDGVKQLVRDVGKMKIWSDGDLNDRLSHWLQAANPSSNYQVALDKHEAQTGLWLLNSIELQDWKASAESFMWLHGSAGCGKTTLSAIALQNIIDDASRRANTAVAYFYFDFNNAEKQKTTQAQRSILFQLALQIPECFKALEEAYQRGNKGRLPLSDESLLQLLTNALAISDRTYLVLDALDECTDISNLISYMCVLVSSSQYKVHVLATSRRERDIERELQPIADHVINIESSLVDKDIDTYVSATLARDISFKKWNQKVKDEIRKQLTMNAHGMFRWAFCQLESLRTCVTRKAILKALTLLPKTLDETYARIIRNLETGYHFQDAVKVLKWLCFSGRPMKLLEVVDIIALNSDTFDPEERLPDPEDVLTICSSLISYHRVRPTATRDNQENSSDEDETDDDNDVVPSPSDSFHDIDAVHQYNEVEVRLAHFSVKEYLLSVRSELHTEFSMPECHDDIAQSCLQYLLHVSGDKASCDDPAEEYPLVQYVGEYWWHHAQLSGEKLSDETVNRSNILFTSDAALLCSVRVFNPKEPWRIMDFSMKLNELESPLFYASAFGLSRTVGFLLRQGTHVNHKSSKYETAYAIAIAAAARHGHSETVRVLLGYAPIPRLHGWEGDALLLASQMGHVLIVKMLLANGANVHGTYLHGTPLHAASKEGHEQVVKILLDSGADVNIRATTYSGGGRGRRTALQMATNAGYTKIVQILLEAGADVEVDELYMDSPLQVAVILKQVEIVRMLLAKGASIECQGDTGPALNTAFGTGNTQIASMMLEKATPDLFSGYELQTAAMDGHLEIVQLLLNSEKYVPPRERVDGALEYAKGRGHTAIVQLLQEEIARKT